MFWNKKAKNKYGDMTEKLYKDDPELAMRIALGEEEAPSGILSSAVYSKVCDEIEKAAREADRADNETEKDKQIEVCMQLANSNNNRGISAEAQRLKLRNHESYIETLREIVNARREAFEKTLPKGKTYEMAVKEEVENIKKAIDESMSTEKDFEDFVSSLDDEKK